MGVRTSIYKVPRTSQYNPWKIWCFFSNPTMMGVYPKSVYWPPLPCSREEPTSCHHVEVAAFFVGFLWIPNMWKVKVCAYFLPSFVWRRILLCFFGRCFVTLFCLCHSSLVAALVLLLMFVSLLSLPFLSFTIYLSSFFKDHFKPAYAALLRHLYATLHRGEGINSSFYKRPWQRDHRICPQKTWNVYFQWSFLVPLIGGRYHIITQFAIYTTYIPGIYCQLGDYMLPIPPIKGTRSSYWYLIR